MQSIIIVTHLFDLTSFLLLQISYRIYIIFRPHRSLLDNTMRKILSVQNISCETLGTFKEFFRSEGYKIKTVQAPSDHLPEDLEEYSAVVILGGPMSVYERLAYLEEEQSLIRNAISKNIPLLGVCLGSQLIAEAIGGKVYRGVKK